MSTPSQTIRLVRAGIALRKSIFIHGPVGIGKSSIVAQIAKDDKMEFMDKRLAQSDPTELKGFPVPDLVKGLMRWLPDSALPPTSSKKKGILFLDELSSAPQAVQAAGYQLCLDRRIGEYVLPEGWTVIAAGNRAIDRAITVRMSSALANRFVHIDMEPDLDDFSALWRNLKMHDGVLGLLKFKSSLLHQYDAAANPLAFPTPRSWFTTNDILTLNLAGEDEHALITGTVGKGAAGELRTFLKIRHNLPTTEAIKLSPESIEVPEDPSACYALLTTLASATTKAAYQRYIKYIARMKKPWQVVYHRDALKVDDSIQYTPEFTKWTLENSDITL